MEDNVFCCSNLQPYRPKTLDLEPKFIDFISWAKWASLGTSCAAGKPSDTQGATEHYPYAVQLVRQVNYGPLESKRYFVPEDNSARDFVEVTADDLVDANFEKVNSYKNFKCLIHNKFFEVNLYEKDPVNRHHWRATISRPAEEIDIPAKPMKAARSGSFQLSKHLPNKSLAQGSEQQHVSPKPNPGSSDTKFSNDPIFDILASKVNAPVNLEPAWKKLLSTGEIARFIIDCGHGYELFASAESEPFIRALETRVATSLGLKSHLTYRTRLGELLLDMIEKLNRETEEEMRVMQADFSNSINFMSVMFEDTTNDVTRPDRSNIRSGQGLNRRDLLEMIRQALDVVHNGPSPSFRIDLYRNARGLVSSRSCDVKKMELMDERLPERHDSAVMESGFVPQFRRSDTGVDIGALSESDSSERWDYSRHNDYGDNGYDSPRDFTAIADRLLTGLNSELAFRKRLAGLMRARESIVTAAAATTADARPGRPEASPTADALGNYPVAYLASHLIVFDTGEIDRRSLRKQRVRGEPPQVAEPAQRSTTCAA
ncbi:hypothetical protein V500_01053 [Pseudogymnoascus sp. VKM F-4518 (FW-2643)]|nr:hypothetical protein V500_01053 [Pseudogymnoascus sp. VKM F-4518 (FW-2643)]